jgi:hypothetical protein
MYVRVVAYNFLKIARRHIFLDQQKNAKNFKKKNLVEEGATIGTTALVY